MNFCDASASREANEQSKPQSLKRSGLSHLTAIFSLEIPEQMKTPFCWVSNWCISWFLKWSYIHKGVFLWDTDIGSEENNTAYTKRNLSSQNLFTSSKTGNWVSHLKHCTVLKYMLPRERKKTEHREDTRNPVLRQNSQPFFPPPFHCSEHFAKIVEMFREL